FSTTSPPLLATSIPRSNLFVTVSGSLLAKNNTVTSANPAKVVLFSVANGVVTATSQATTAPSHAFSFTNVPIGPRALVAQQGPNVSGIYYLRVSAPVSINLYVDLN